MRYSRVVKLIINCNYKENNTEKGIELKLPNHIIICKTKAHN